jgi:hypothetical protein
LVRRCVFMVNLDSMRGLCGQQAGCVVGGQSVAVSMW